MDRDVKVTVLGIQDDGSGNEAVTGYQADGQYYERDGCRFLLYREQDSDSGAMTSNTLKIGDGILELSRRGNVNSRMIFEAGHTHPASHTTAYGTLVLDVCTENVNCLWTESTGKVIITYNLWMTGEFLSKNRLTIEINPAKG